MSDWHWEVPPDDLLEGLPAEAREQVEQILTDVRGERVVILQVIWLR